MAVIGCKLCGSPVEIKATGAYRELMGWTRKRDQGGANSITLASDPMAWAHGGCIEELKQRSRTSWAEASHPTTNCEFCLAIISDEAGVYRKVIGWAQVRKQGGSNSISLASEALGWAHGDCIDQQKKRGSVSWKESSLFD